MFLRAFQADSQPGRTAANPNHIEFLLGRPSASHRQCKPPAVTALRFSPSRPNPVTYMYAETSAETPAETPAASRYGTRSVGFSIATCTCNQRERNRSINRRHVYRKQTASSRSVLGVVTDSVTSIDPSASKDTVVIRSSPPALQPRTCQTTTPVSGLLEPHQLRRR